jgi:hypothetical protein
MAKQGVLVRGVKPHLPHIGGERATARVARCRGDGGLPAASRRGRRLFRARRRGGMVAVAGAGAAAVPVTAEQEGHGVVVAAAKGVIELG